MRAMKYFWLLIVALSLAACSSSRTSHYDEFEKMKPYKDKDPEGYAWVKAEVDHRKGA